MRSCPDTDIDPRRDWNFLGSGGGGVCKTPKFKEMCEALLEFPEGWGGGGGRGGLGKNPFHVGGMHIFRNQEPCRNYTIAIWESTCTSKPKNAPLILLKYVNCTSR